MNILAHLRLSPGNPELLVGNLMGDFVKGRLDDRYPPLIRQGIELHRRIDSFAGSNSFFRTSRQRIAPSFGLFRGVLVDLFYDHFLAREWHDWSDQPFDSFVSFAYDTVKSYQEILPERLARLVPVIFTELLPSYRESEGIGRALRRMSQRIGRSNPLGGGEEELNRLYPELREDFRGFFPAALAFVRTREIRADGQGR